MNDLFRFLLLRPAATPAPGTVQTVMPSFTNSQVTRQAAQDAAGRLAAAGRVLTSGAGLTYAAPAGAVAQALAAGPLSPADIDALLRKVAGKSANAIVDDRTFGVEQARLGDSLVAMKLLSSSLGGDAPGIEQLVRGYDAIARAAGGGGPVALRALALPDFSAPARAQAGAAAPAAPTAAAAAPADPAVTPRPTLNQLDAAITALGAIKATDFARQPAVVSPPVVGEERRGEVTAADAAIVTPERPTAVVATQVKTPWLLSNVAVRRLTSDVRATLATAGLDVTAQPLPVLLNTLDRQKIDLLSAIEAQRVPLPGKVLPIGGGFDQVTGPGYVGAPASGLPTGHGNVRPVGVGDLLMVKQHVLRYEGGDLAHVENILKSEHLARETRRLERTETTVLEETETTKEEEQDTQTTDRFSLSRETSDTIQSDSSLKAGLSVDAKYGPMVEVKANADYATSTATTSATKTASEFSKDVVARSVSSLVERVLERRTTTTISEFEEKYSHGFDNTNGTGHISGFYQWIDKVLQAQVYNYGKRLMFDVTVPEPGTNFILTQTKVTDQGQTLQAPIPFTLSADQLNEGNYLTWAARYQATGLEPPPPPVITVAKSFDATLGQNPHETTKSDTLSVDDGYAAKYALFNWDMIFWKNAFFRVMIGSRWCDAFNSDSYLTMAGETGTVPIAFDAYEIELLAFTVEIFCERTPTAYAAWQIKVHAAITQAYQARQQSYDEALSQAKAAAGVVISGRNPAFNARLVDGELRRQCLTLITAQQFDGFGALELSSQGFAQPSLALAEQQMPYVRFFEQAFEWEHLTFFYYPYFWGWKGAWQKHMLLDDVDPQFADFLRAGAARVVFPVRPGFEAAVVHYVETGEIWNGGPPPDISSSLYVPIVTEIEEATGAPGTEVPVGDPWLVYLPTTLVQLRPNNDLPAWQKVGEDWQPTN